MLFDTDEVNFNRKLLAQMDTQMDVAEKMSI